MIALVLGAGTLGVIVADAAGSFVTAAAALAVAVLAASFTFLLNRKDVVRRRDLEECRRRLDAGERNNEGLRKERAFLRERNELVIAALLGLLPQPQRLELLSKLDERTPAEEGRYYGEMDEPRERRR